MVESILSLQLCLFGVFICTVPVSPPHTIYLSFFLVQSSFEYVIVVLYFRV